MSKTAEQIAAEKAEQEKKAAEKNKEGSDEGAGTDGDKDEEGEGDDKEEDPAALKAQIKKLRDENAKKRVSEKAAKEENERYKKALKALGVKGEEGGDELSPIEKSKLESEAKVKRAMIKAELAVVARDAHNPNVLLQSFPSKFKDIEVDVDGESVDSEALKEAVESIRKDNPWMFQPKEGTKAAVTPGKKAPDNGRPTGGVDHKAEWQRLKQGGQNAAAAKYYAEHKAMILSQL